MTDEELIRCALNAADFDQQDEAWEAFNRLLDERDAALERLRAPKRIILKGDEYEIRPCSDGTVDVIFVRAAVASE